MKYPIIVLAGTKEEYLQYLAAMEFTPRDAVFAADLDYLLGLWGSALAKIGTFENRSNWRDIEQMAVTRLGRFPLETWFTPYIRTASKPQLEHMLTKALKVMPIAEQEMILDSVVDLIPEGSTT